MTSLTNSTKQTTCGSLSVIVCCCCFFPVCLNKLVCIAFSLAEQVHVCPSAQAWTLQDSFPFHLLALTRPCYPVLVPGQVSVCPFDLLTGYTLFVEDEDRSANALLTRADMEAHMVSMDIRPLIK